MKKIASKIGILVTMILAGILLTKVALAYQIPTEYMPDNTPFNIPYSASKSPESPIIFVLQIVAGTLLYVAAPLAIISIVMAAFSMTMKSGSTEGVEGAKKHLQWAIIGLVVIMFSYAISQAIIGLAFDSFNDKTPATAPAGQQTTPNTPAAPTVPKQ